MDLFDEFKADKCTSCGECFHQCPVMQLDSDVAKEEVARLASQQETKYVLKQCTSCFACNLTCPEGCNPAQRILDVWRDRSMRDGLPARARYFTPHSTPNYRTYVADRLPEDERALVASCKDTSPCDEVFYPGCNVITSPYLTRTALLDGVNIRGSLDLCCGETYYRAGLYDMVERSAQQLAAWHDKLRFKKMIIPCAAGWNTFVNVLPKFGLKRDFEVQHMLCWLLERIESGEIQITRPLNLTVTIQDSCYGKTFGDAFLNVPRTLLGKIGVTVIEQELSAKRSLCCGIGGGFSHASGYHPWDITRSTIRTLRLAGRTGAEAIAVYCAGCLQMLSVGQIVYPNRMPVYHILELLQMAIGETPEGRRKKRARLTFRGVMVNQFPKVLSKKRFFTQDLP